jgi:catechol 2,3-dioxygenase-like lactoylglutathione lyase family enzyme
LGESPGATRRPARGAYASLPRGNHPAGHDTRSGWAVGNTRRRLTTVYGGAAVANRIVHVRLAAPAERIAALHRFYGDTLGLPVHETPAGLSVQAGAARIDLERAPGEPFYHVALLVPGDRFEAARDWLGERAKLLPDARGEVDFDFSFWDACACYCADPAGTILELIAHRGIGERGARGAFGAAEVLGVSEVGLVGPDLRAMGAAVAGEAAMPIWDGSADRERGLAFAGERAHTLILASEGRGWLPTGRPAEVHPVDISVEGERALDVAIPGTPHRVRRVVAGR